MEPPETGLVLSVNSIFLQSHLFYYEVGLYLVSAAVLVVWYQLAALSNANYQSVFQNEEVSDYAKHRFSLSLWFLFFFLLAVWLFQICYGSPVVFALVALFLLSVPLALFGKNSRFTYSPSVVSAFSFLSQPFYKLNNRFNQPEDNKDSMVHDLEQVLESNEGETTAEEQQMLQGIVKFSSTEVRQIMTPKDLVVSVSDTYTLAEILETVRENGYSRMPVITSQNGQLLGTLHAKDLIALIAHETQPWQELVRPPYLVQQTKKIIDLLEQFQQRKTHLALVVDEFQNHVGLVTLEDVIEEIVGDISDEFDDEEVIFSKLDAHNFIFEGKTLLAELTRLMAVDSKTFDGFQQPGKTLAGFLQSIIDYMPRKGAKINFKNLLFTVESVDKRRIKRVKITIVA